MPRLSSACSAKRRSHSQGGDIIVGLVARYAIFVHNAMQFHYFHGFVKNFSEQLLCIETKYFYALHHRYFRRYYVCKNMNVIE